MDAEQISTITDYILEEVQQWQSRPLKKFYTFLFVDCMHVTVRKDYETKSYAVYAILGYDNDGVKEIPMDERNRIKAWMDADLR